MTHGLHGHAARACCTGMLHGQAVHLCMAVYAVHDDSCALASADGGFPAALRPEPRGERRMAALQKEAAALFRPPPQTYRREEACVWPDMIDGRGALRLSTIMDLMERQRTELIGGQEILDPILKIPHAE